jgi:molybdopterin synthase sulfur carrier subunit
MIMAIEVRIPTILRTYTGGSKTVEGAGDTLAALLADLDSRHSGLRGRLITEQGGLHRFVNIYVNDEDVRFLGSLDAKLSDGDNVTILPAVAGGAFGFAAAAALLGRSTSPLSRASDLDVRRPKDQAPQAALR